MKSETTAYKVHTMDFTVTKDDSEFRNYVVERLSRALSDKITKILDTEGEIIIKKSDIRIMHEMYPDDMVEYRQAIQWKPLVRCRDCMHQHECRLNSFRLDPDGYCHWGDKENTNEES